MRVYPIPSDLNEKEKIIGGILNLNQFFWVIGGLAFGAVVFVLTYFSFQVVVLSAILGLVLATSGLPFALYKRNQLTLFQYLWYKHTFKRKVKHLPNIRKENGNEIWLSS